MYISSVNDLIHCYLTNLLCAFFMLVLVHTCILHFYHNLLCEVTRFGDREFYNVSVLICCATFNEGLGIRLSLIPNLLPSFMLHMVAIHGK